MERINKLYLGKCEEVLKEFDDNSVDTIITDPPAGISFMGKSWDSDKGGRDKWIGWFTGIMTECYRIIKPGGIALVWAIPRTSHWTATAIENAGFRINDIIMHIFGSGFPKSLDISKSIDKSIKIIDLFKPFANHYKKQRKKIGLTHNQICSKGNFYYKHNHGGASSNWELGLNIPTLEQWKILKSILNLSDNYLPLIERIEAEREIIGKKNGITAVNQSGIGGMAVGIKQESIKIDITTPATPEAQQWDGYGTGLKPAAEHWIFAMKPCEGTYAQNALKYGVAGININGGRIGTEDNLKRQCSDKAIWGNSKLTKKDIIGSAKGRWPANIILDEESAAVLDEQSGVLKSGDIKPYKGNYHNATSYKIGKFMTCDKKGDSGGASRFFYCAKASKSERNRGCEHLCWLDGKEITKELWEALDAENEANKNNKDYKKHDIATSNIHPTVKSISLMEYLCTLTKTPMGNDIVLDPFMGSGTTGIACKNTGRGFIGIEEVPEYYEMAKCRIEYEEKQEQIKIDF